jgi:hypothetical protein
MSRRRAAQLPAEVVVDDAVGLAGAVVPGGDQAVEFSAEQGYLFVGGELRGSRVRGGVVRVGSLGALLLGDRLGLAFAEEFADLVGFQQAGEA